MIIPALQPTPYVSSGDQGEATVEKEILPSPNNQEQSQVLAVMGGKDGLDEQGSPGWRQVGDLIHVVDEGW